MLANKKIFGNHPVKLTYTSEFYSQMMTSTGLQSCRMRFFYFINGEPVTISSTHLDIYIRFANKLTVEPQRIARVQLNIQGDLQQRWNKAVVPFQSTQPFQFVFRGYLGTNASRIAVDDISFDNNNCAASSVQPLTPTPPPVPTTPSPAPTNSGNNPTPTPKPGLNNDKSSSGKGGKVAAGILIPLFIVFGAIAAFFGYKKYQKSQRGNDNIALTMKGIQEDTDY